MERFQNVEVDTINVVYIYNILNKVSNDLADNILDVVNDMSNFTFGSPDNAGNLMTAKTFLEKVIGNNDFDSEEKELQELREYIKTLIENDVLINF